MKARLERLDALPAWEWELASFELAVERALAAVPFEPVPGRPDVVDVEPSLRKIASAIGVDPDDLVAEVREIARQDGWLRDA